MSITVSDRPAWLEGARQDNALSSLILSAAEAEEADRKRTNPVRLSSAGRCQRQIAYAYHNWLAEKNGKAKPFPAEPMEPRVLVNFTLGDLTELTVVDWLLKRASGRFMPLPASRKNAVRLDMGHGNLVFGHLDGLWQEEDGSLSVVDVKSINTYGFERLEEQGPPMELVAQVNAYCAAMELPSWRLIFLRKETGHLSEWFGKFNGALFSATLNRFRRVLASTVTELPDREYQPRKEAEWVPGRKRLVGSCADEGDKDPDGKTITAMKKTGYWRESGRRILEFPCSYCAFKSSCWPSVTMEMKGDRPMWVIQE